MKEQGTSVERLGWAVTALDGTTILARGDGLTERVLDRWEGTARLWRVGRGDELLPLTHEDYDCASRRKQGKS